MELILIAGVIILVILLFNGNRTGQGARRSAFGRPAAGLSLEDEKAEARRWIERLGGQVLNLEGNDTPSKQAMSDAAERFTAAGSQIEQATTPHQAKLAKDTALEGLYYVRAARTAMGLDPGPELPKDRERERAGAVTEARQVDVEGHEYQLSPEASERTPYYHPGGRVAGRPVPAGWYSERWWAPALATGVWAMGSMMMFNAMFIGMAGVASAGAWEQGQDAGQESGDGSDAGGEGADGADAGGDGGDYGDGGGDFGGGDGFGDFGGGDFGGGDFGGGGFGDFGF